MVTKLGTAYVRFFGHNEKIVEGLTEADTKKHYLDLSRFVPVNTTAIIVRAVRISGSGTFYVYPNEGNGSHTIDSMSPTLVAIKNQRLQYALEVANDVWNIWLFGYFVEYPISRLKKEG